MKQKRSLKDFWGLLSFVICYYTHICEVEGFLDTYRYVRKPYCRVSSALLQGEKTPLASEESLATMFPLPSSSTSTPAPAARRGNVTIIANLLGSRSLGLDWGHKKIGIALSAGFSERPIGTIPNGGKLSTNATINRPTLDEILGILRHEAAERIVIGNPLFRDGSLSPQANSTKAFARLLVNRAVELGIVQDPSVPFIYLWDERLTSQAAKVNIKTKSFLYSSSDIDSQAACLVLEDFYQAKGQNAEVVYPDEGITRLVPPLSSQSEKGSASDGNASAKAASPVKSPVMSFDEFRRAELERYGRPGGALPSPSSSSSEDESGKKKKKKKKKR